MSTSFDSRPGPARRLARLLLVLGWAAVLLAACGIAGYLAWLAPAPEPQPQAQLRQALPPPAVSQEVAPPPQARAEPETESSAADPAETGPASASETGGGDDMPPPPPTDSAETAEPARAADGSDAEAPARQSPEEPAGSDTASDGGEETADSGDTPRTSEPAPADGAADETTAPPVPAWQRYGRRITPPEGLPKIAVVVRGLGLSSAASEAAITRLPEAVSLSFSPYARQNARAWAARARQQGHEVLIDLPMEPSDYPTRDPGPKAMMSRLNAAQNLDRLDWLLAQAEREVGVVADMGSAFLREPQAVEPVLRELKARGLMYLDNGAVPDNAALRLAGRMDLPHAVNDRTLDGGQVSRPAIEARLVEAERVARQDGLAVVLARPFPVTLDVVEAWTRRLEERGFVLVPVTYAADRRARAATANLR